MKYFPQLDGLRAIAIILVICFHAGLSIFPSGFIGVDIFFVISGFLITTIINESLHNNSFSFIDFYTRRLWRLQPVFIALLFFTLCLTLLFYLPNDLMDYNRSARKASLFSSNLFFGKTTTGYFSSDSTQLPLLHTWSLSIEWQFYLILPIFMYLLHRFFSKNNFNNIIYFITFLSFFLSLYTSINNPITSYYQSLGRIFEFFIGASIALLPLGFIATIKLLPLPSQLGAERYVWNIITFLAITTLFYIAIQSDIKHGFPNIYALIVCIATAIIIISTRFNYETITTQLLSTKPFVFLGLISYSLYVWHWPILALTHYQSVEQSTMNLILVFLVILITAYLSWRYIEKPTRKLNKTAWLPSIICLLIIPISFTQLNDWYVKKNNGFPERFNAELVQIYNQSKRYSSSERPLCIGHKKVDLDKNCILGALNADKKGFIIGDSFSNHFWKFMDVLGKNAKVSILAQGTSSCLTLPDIYLYDFGNYKGQIYQECYKETARYFEMIKKNHYDFVIIGQAWRNYIGDNIITKLSDKRSPTLTKKRFAKALDKALQQIIDSGAKPVLIKSTAYMQNNFHDCFYKHIKLRTQYNPESCNFTLSLSDEEKWLDQVFHNLKNKYPQLEIIDPLQIQCADGKCEADIHGMPIYRDVGHITDYASWYFGKLYLEKFKNPLV